MISAHVKLDSSERLTTDCMSNCLTKNCDKCCKGGCEASGESGLSEGSDFHEQCHCGQLEGASWVQGTAGEGGNCTVNYVVIRAVLCPNAEIC